METALVSGRGQLVVPARIRHKYGIATGTRVRFLEVDGKLVLQPVTPEWIRSVAGLLKDHGSGTAELARERDRDRRKEEAKVGTRRPR